MMHEAIMKLTCPCVLRSITEISMNQTLALLRSKMHNFEDIQFLDHASVLIRLNMRDIALMIKECETMHAQYSIASIMVDLEIRDANEKVAESAEQVDLVASTTK